MHRFMAHVMENGLNVGLRTDQDFIRHFPPMEIMTGLAERPDLRANILVPTTGVRSKIAMKKDAESAGRDLQISLDEGETTAQLIVSLFHPDDRVRYLDQVRLWDYIIEPRFWTIERKQTSDFERAKAHMAFILDRAIEEKLVTHREIVEGITVAHLVKCLPPAELTAILETALNNSHSNKPFTEQDFLRAFPTIKLTESVQLSVLWEQVVQPLVAVRNQLVAGGKPAKPTTTPYRETADVNASANREFAGTEENPSYP